MQTIILTVLYLVAIITANLSVAFFGPSSTIINAFLFIGLDLTTRDRLHEAWHGNHLIQKMTLLIATGSAISFLLNKDAGPIALASFAAFGLAALADALVYHFLRKRTWFIRSNGSNIAGAVVDSIVFPTIAFGTLLPEVILGQFIAKALGGLFWSFVLSRYRTTLPHNLAQDKNTKSSTTEPEPAR